MSISLQPHGLQQARPPVHHQHPEYSNSYPLSQWCHPTISSSVVPFSSHLLSFPASGSCQMRQVFESDGQSIGVSASASVLPMNIQDWFPLGWTGLISLQSKGLSRVFSKTTVQKHQFYSAQLSSQSNSHIHTWLLEKTIALTRWTLAGKVMSLLFNMLSRWVITFLQGKASFNFMAAVTICSDFGAPKIKSLTVFIVPPFICHDWMPWQSMRLDAMILVFWMSSFFFFFFGFCF